MHKVIRFIPPVVLITLLSRHAISLLFDGVNYWLAFYAITHLCLLLLAFALIRWTLVKKWGMVWLKIIALVVSQDIIDRIFFNVYTYDISDFALAVTSSWIILKASGVIDGFKLMLIPVVIKIKSFFKR